MRDFQNNRRDDRRGGGRDFKPRRDFGGPQEMHKAICSNCGKECEVPFKPNGSKPVFCRECFQANRTGEAPRNDNYSRRPDFHERPGPAQRPPEPPRFDREFQELNTKLDKLISLLSPKEEVKVEEPVEEVKQPEEIIIPIIKKRKKVKVAPEIIVK